MKKDQYSESTGSVDAIFEEALKIGDLVLRRKYLEEACRDAAMVAEVEELIAADGEAGGFLGETNATVVEAPRKDVAVAGEPRIPGIKIGRLLGRGGLGAVYEAFDEKLQRNVAIKVLAREAGTHRIVAEARKAAALRDAAIVTIYSVHDEGEWPAINMELIEGFPVDRAAANLSFEQRARILQQIARGIAVAHKAGVIHRDLKPENVILTPDLQPKVLDFGLAVSLEEGSVRRAFFEGTPRYASPEQVAGKPLTPASDVFSFGSLMFKILTGRAAFDGATAVEILEAICTTQPPFLRDVAVGVPEDLQAICLACMAWKPEDRPSAEDVAVDLGRFLAGENVKLRPALYGDILRQKISEYSGALGHWEKQGMISADEKDRLEAVHRRILADEDHWIVDARKISVAQTLLYSGAWLVVVSAVMLVWLARAELKAPLTWLAPLAGTVWLLGAGVFSARRKDTLASASFLAGAALSVAPTTLALLKEVDVISFQAPGVKRLMDEFSNAQILGASLTSLGLSAFAWARLKMTGFAWTTAVLGALTYWSLLLCLNWLDQHLEIQALWLLPLVSFEWVGLFSEKKGQVRWAMPFHWISLAVMLGTLDTIAMNGPTLRMLGVTEERFPFFVKERLEFLSIALNGYLFLVLMLMTERARSLDLRRASRVLEPLALLHMMGPLYLNAHGQSGSADVKYDVALYLGTVGLLLLIGPWRSSWRILVGALGGLAFGSYLLLDLGLVSKAGFSIGLGVAGFLVSGGVYWFLVKVTKRASRPRPGD